MSVPEQWPKKVKLSAMTDTIRTFPNEQDHDRIQVSRTYILADALLSDEAVEAVVAQQVPANCKTSGPRIYAARVAQVRRTLELALATLKEDRP